LTSNRLYSNSNNAFEKIISKNELLVSKVKKEESNNHIKDKVENMIKRIDYKVKKTYPLREESINHRTIADILSEKDIDSCLKF